MEYNEMIKKVFATGSIPDGYFGDRASVKFAFDDKSGKTIIIAGCGCFCYQTPPAIDKHEALWLLNNHPFSNARNVRGV